jgi:ABC-type glycerol-3-phosphate transport system permease component
MTVATIARRRPNVMVELSLLILMIAVFVPILWTALLAFLPNRAIINPAWEFPFWLGNFRTLLEPGQPFLRQTVNSTVITLGSVVICLLVGGAAGYALSRLQPPKWITLPSLILAAFLPLVPPMTLVPGLYVSLGKMGLLGSVTGLVLLNALFNLPFAALMLKSYFDQVPEELREAALVDGASELRALLSVILPLAKPGFIAVGIYVAIMAWNEFLMGLTMTTGGDSAPLTVGIASLVQPFAITFGEMAAAGFAAGLPIIVMAAVANRHIVAGLTAGAVKS